MGKRGPKPVDMTGRMWGRLVALEYVGNGYWRFSCQCGEEKVLWATDVRREKIQSCGCISREVKKTGNLRRTHGGCGKPEYASWNAMLVRCYNPKAAGYHRYGGRGISVCDRWREDFNAFLEDMGERPPGTSLDRIDPNGNYEPSNCRWATNQIQSTNKVCTVKLTANGETRPISDWAKSLGTSTYVIHARIKRGWSVEDAVTRPVKTVRRW